MMTTIRLQKSCIRSQLTDEHSTSLLKIVTSYFEPDFEELLRNAVKVSFIVLINRILKIIVFESLLSFIINCIDQSKFLLVLYFNPPPKQVASH